jgi:hypothetical protein
MEERKVRAAQGGILPNGKASRLVVEDRQCHRKQTTGSDAFRAGKGEKAR